MGVCSFLYLYVFGVNRGGVLLKSTTEREWLGLVPDYLYSFIMYCSNVLLRSRRLRCGLVLHYLYWYWYWCRWCTAEDNGCKTGSELSVLYSFSGVLLRSSNVLLGVGSALSVQLKYVP